MKSISGLADSIARGAGVLVGLSALGYYVGYRIQSHYFSEAGARWVLDMLSPTVLVREGQVVIIVVGTTAFLSLMHLFSNDGSADKLKRKDLILSVIAIVLLGAAFISGKVWSNNKLDYVLSIVAGGLMAAAAGFTVGELVGRLDESESKWSGYHLYLLWFFYISAIAMAPYYIGMNRAKFDLDPTLSTLPFVTVTNDKTGQWRLMRAVGENYLLVKLNDDRYSREFRLVIASSAVVSSDQPRPNEFKRNSAGSAH